MLTSPENASSLVVMLTGFNAFCVTTAPLCGHMISLCWLPDIIGKSQPLPLFLDRGSRAEGDRATAQELCKKGILGL